MNPIIFLHVQKTGGTSVRSVVRSVFGQERVFEDIHCKSNGEWVTPCQDADAWQAHMPFGLHAQLSRPVPCFTVVRDPIAREVSRFRSQPMLRKDWKTTPAATVDRSWGLVYLLSGIPLDLAGGLGEEHVELALRNLREHFLFVGDTSRFDELGEWMRDIMGWPVELPLPHENSSDVHGIDVTAEEIEELNDHPQVQLDQMLYQRICDLGPHPKDWLLQHVAPGEW
jgi:hypothetical protein